MVSYDKHDERTQEKALVLILVVVDDGLVQTHAVINKIRILCLNPCCSGRWSRTRLMAATDEGAARLNPCCSGRWSRTGDNVQLNAEERTIVLILVVVDDGLVLI